MTKHIILSTIAVATISLFSSVSFACNIGTLWSIHQNEAVSYASDYWASPYDSNHVNTLVQRYQMDRGNWDNGWGWYAANVAWRPFARTMNALTLIRFASEGGWIVSEGPIDQASADYSMRVVNWLRDVKWFSSNAIDELDGECRNGSRVAKTQWGPIIDNFTDLYVDFFYTRRLPEQAAVIVHEAVHANWGSPHSSHDGGDNCPARGSCDKTWAMWNATSLHATYLWAMTRSGYTLSNSMREYARSRAVYRLSAYLNSPVNANNWNWCIDNRYRSFFSSLPACY